jgi:hypothetical protein
VPDHREEALHLHVRDGEDRRAAERQVALRAAEGEGLGRGGDGVSEWMEESVGSVAKSSASVGTGVRGRGRGRRRGGCSGRCRGDDRRRRRQRTRGDGERAAEAHRRAVGFVTSSSSQAGAGTGSRRVADVDADVAEVEDRMGRAGTEGEGKEAGERVMKPLACEA